MDIGNTVKEHTEKTVKCKTNSSNPASLVDMEFFIDGTKQNHITPQVLEIPGLNNGIVKSFAFNFTTERSQHGKIAKCSPKWNGTYIETTKAILNITCE